VTNGGFQNHLHFLYGLPGGIIAKRDTSDILDRWRKYQKQEQQLEEELAAKLLQKQQTNIEIPNDINEDKLGNILQQKLNSKPQKGELVGADRIKRVKLLLLLLELEDVI